MVIFYTIGCPKCRVLKRKLDEKGIAYETCTDASVMEKKGITDLPQLEVDGLLLDFPTAIAWVEEHK